MQHILLFYWNRPEVNTPCEREDVQMPFQEPQMPSYPIPEGYTQRSYVEELLEKGWKWRGFDKMSKEDQMVRRERIQEEMDTIDTMGYMGYFIVTWDFINWARNNNVLVGVGRGSAGSSMVCYLLGITNLDPIRYGLVFSRFLNIERRGLPKPCQLGSINSVNATQRCAV